MPKPGPSLCGNGAGTAQDSASSRHEQPGRGGIPLLTPIASRKLLKPQERRGMAGGEGTEYADAIVGTQVLGHRHRFSAD